MDNKSENNTTFSKIHNINYGRFCNPSTLNIFIRALCLFILGISLSCLLNVMLILPELRRKVVYERDLLDRLYATTWWFAPCCGTASTLIGLLYPCVDSRLGKRPRHLRTEWSSVVRCAALFIGIIHAAVKLRFQSDVHLFITIASFSVLLWWYFDGSKNGFALGLLIAVGATACLLLMGPPNIFSEKMARNQLWVPCLFFCGGVTVGKIGKQLAMIEYVPSTRVKPHVD